MDVKIRNNNYKFKFRVSAIFIYESKILVNKYVEDSYCLPGGYVEIWETSEKAILRELKEELDLDFVISSFAGVIENFFVNSKKEKTHEIDFYYFVKLKNNNDHEKIDYDRAENDNGRIIHHHFKWLDLNNLEKYNLLPSIIKEEIKQNGGFFHKVVKEV